GRGRGGAVGGAVGLFGLGAGWGLAVDDGAAEAALYMVGARLDPVGVSEGPKRGPAVEEVVGEHAVVLGAWALPRRVFEHRVELRLERRGLDRQRGPVSVLPVCCPGD